MDRAITRMSIAGRSSSQPGFSLLELIVVMAILSVCVALVAPGLSPERFTDSMKTGIRRFSAVLAQARNQAMISGERQMLLVDYSRQGSGNRVCYRLLSASEEAAAEDGISESGATAATGCFPYGIRIEQVETQHDSREEGTARFAVLPSGLIQPGLIYLQKGDRKRTLRVRPFQPYPQVLQGHPRRGEGRPRTGPRVGGSPGGYGADGQ